MQVHAPLPLNAIAHTCLPHPILQLYAFATEYPASYMDAKDSALKASQGEPGLAVFHKQNGVLAPLPAPLPLALQARNVISSF